MGRYSRKKPASELLKKGDIVKIVMPPNEDKVGLNNNGYWTSSDDLLVGRLGRIIDVDRDDAAVDSNGDFDELDCAPYLVKFHGPMPEGDGEDEDTYWQCHPQIRKAKKWEIKKYNREKENSK